MEIVELTDDLVDKYETYIKKSERTLFYASNSYRILLREFLEEKDCYFVALDNSGSIKGVLPAILKINKKYGNVLNSLPFYGSNGGVITHEDDDKIKNLLIQRFFEYAKQNECISATIVTSPFEETNSYNNSILCEPVDERIGQITRLINNDGDGIEDLFARFHYKTRNTIRKAQKMGVSFGTNENENSWDFLNNIHVANMQEIGGIAKSRKFFDLIKNRYKHGKEYKIYTAYYQQQPIAALLLLYYNKTVEYYTPVIMKEYRSYQPLSLLIYEAMRDAIESGFKYWNWGGTWLTQDGVYLFKKRWGTDDLKYSYYTQLYNEGITSFNKETILKEFPYFYVIPFGRLT